VHAKVPNPSAIPSGKKVTKEKERKKERKRH
jgi:hypothetical protein